MCKENQDSCLGFFVLKVSPLMVVCLKRIITFVVYVRVGLAFFFWLACQLTFQQSFVRMVKC